MNPFKFLALSGAGYLALVIVFGSGGEAAPSPTVRIPQTVQIVPLTQEQEADRQASNPARDRRLARRDHYNAPTARPD
jgi:hypothetical protein